MTTSTLDKQLAEINRLREAEFRLWNLASAMGRTYDLGTPENKLSQKCSQKAAQIHGKIDSMMRWLPR